MLRKERGAPPLLLTSLIDPPAPLFDLKLYAADEAGYQVVEKSGDKPPDKPYDAVEDREKDHGPTPKNVPKMSTSDPACGEPILATAPSSEKSTKKNPKSNPSSA